MKEIITKFRPKAGTTGALVRVKVNGFRFTVTEVLKGASGLQVAGVDSSGRPYGPVRLEEVEAVRAPVEGGAS